MEPTAPNDPQLIRMRRAILSLLTDTYRECGPFTISFGELLAELGYTCTPKHPYGQLAIRKRALPVLQGLASYGPVGLSLSIVPIENLSHIPTSQDPLWLVCTSVPGQRVLKRSKRQIKPVVDVLNALIAKRKDRTTLSRLLVLSGYRVPRGTAGRDADRCALMRDLDRLRTLSGWAIEYQDRRDVSGDHVYVYFRQPGANAERVDYTPKEFRKPRQPAKPSAIDRLRKKVLDAAKETGFVERDFISSPIVTHHREE